MYIFYLTVRTWAEHKIYMSQRYGVNNLPNRFDYASRSFRFYATVVCIFKYSQHILAFVLFDFMILNGEEITQPSSSFELEYRKRNLPESKCFLPVLLFFLFFTVILFTVVRYTHTQKIQTNKNFTGKFPWSRKFNVSTQIFYINTKHKLNCW